MFKSDRHIVLATRNKGKIAEFEALLAGFGLTVLGLGEFPEFPEVEESGVTFAENALLKARAAALHSGLVAVADDSGIVVDALNGAPGVYSARYSAEPGVEATDERNNAKLLKLMRGLPGDRRGAAFCSVIAAARPDGEAITAKGIWPGLVTDAPKGSNGFGYDPLFFDPELGLTAAEMSREQKNSRSHRARALRELLKQWPDFWNSAKSALARGGSD